MKRPKREDYYIAGETDYEIALESYIDHLERLYHDVSKQSELIIAYECKEISMTTQWLRYLMRLFKSITYNGRKYKK